MIILHEITYTLSDSLNNLLLRIAEQQSIVDDFDKYILHEAGVIK